MYAPQESHSNALAVAAVRKKELLQTLYALEPETPMVSGPEDAAIQFMKYKDRKIEYFFTLSLDNKNNLIKRHEISKGTVDQTSIYAREVFRPTLMCHGSGIVLGHNHPGGDPTPSRQDMELTTKLAEAAQILGVRLLDHIVVARSGHFSFQENAYL